MKKTLSISLLAFALAITGCAGSPEVEKDTPVATEIAYPDTERGVNSKWVVDQLNSGELDPLKWEDKLSEKLLEELSADELVKVLHEGLTPGTPHKLVSFTESGNQAILGLLGSDQKEHIITLSYEENGEINGIFFKKA